MSNLPTKRAPECSDGCVFPVIDFDREDEPIFACGQSGHPSKPCLMRAEPSLSAAQSPERPLTPTEAQEAASGQHSAGSDAFGQPVHSLLDCRGECIAHGGTVEWRESLLGDDLRLQALSAAVDVVVLAHSQGVLTARDYERLARMVETKP